MTNAKLKTYLKRVNACVESIEWLGERDLATAWSECERADWLLWLAAKRCDRKAVVLAACACARKALKYVPKGEDRPRIAIETAEAWTRGEATIEQVRTAASAANAAYARSSSLREMADIVRGIIKVEDLWERT